MLLPFTSDLIVTNHFDPEMAMLADRHYSRRTVGARQFMNNGKKLVIRNTEGTLLFGWMFPDPAMRMDSQTGYNCAIFRNESRRRSSEIILECERLAIDKWGQDRMYTFIDPKKIRSVNPGYCFKCAGWHTEGLTQSGKHILVKCLP
ncbi:MAG TPA: hypothetical protein VER98_18565 [Terriglobia bacterium]|nr:hypothetical protein [Terriglobia bacterium]